MPISTVSLEEAIELFLSTAEEEIKKKGESSSGGILIAFYLKCIDKYNNPPPDYDYFKLLEENSKFESIIKYIGKEKTKVWRLRERGQQSIDKWIGDDDSNGEAT